MVEKWRFTARGTSRSALLRMSSNFRSLVPGIVAFISDNLASIDWGESPEVNRSSSCES